MGSDVVELVMRSGETFSVRIPDRLAPELTKPREVAEYILTRVEESRVPLPRLSQKAFHLLRRGFGRHAALPRRQLRLDATLGELVSEERRGRVWRELGSAVGAKKWPALTRSGWLSFIPPEVRGVRDLVGYLVTNEPTLGQGRGVGVVEGSGVGRAQASH